MDTVDYLRFLAALFFVLGLISLLAWLVRRSRPGGIGAASGRRLAVVETLPLDARRRLVLVRRDGTVHLLLLGADRELVVEAGARRAAGVAPSRRAGGEPPPGRGDHPPSREGAPPAAGGGRTGAAAGAVATLLGLALVVALALALATSPAAAQSLNLDLGEGGSATGQLVRLVLLITVLSLAPSILVMVTSFTRIVIVLSFLRTAIGLQQTPPNAVLVSLALFLTAFVMAPTFERAWREGVAPLIEEEIDEAEALRRVAEPLRAFMLDHVRGKDLELFLDLAEMGARRATGEGGGGAPPGNGGAAAAAGAEDAPLRALVPAFMISELRRAFEIGFLIFVPFLIIDMVVASVLMSMGMMMLPPVLISLPFKLIFFVLVDGWYLVVGSLVESFAGP
ncbi:MAG TPA: flagellar biosynthetic protein FliO [Geminicoccaceae bacterium]|nr:flagellar biosynthetic protein FliO [Geminicoccaceae bacterium]